MVTSLVTFQYEGNSYTVPQNEVESKCVIVLPDGVVLLVTKWWYTNPKQPRKMVEVEHVLKGYNLREIAEHMDGVLASRVKDRTVAPEQG